MSGKISDFLSFAFEAELVRIHLKIGAPFVTGTEQNLAAENMGDFITQIVLKTTENKERRRGYAWYPLSLSLDISACWLRCGSAVQMSPTCKVTFKDGFCVHIARVSGHRCVAQRPDCAPSGHPIIEAFC